MHRLGVVQARLHEIARDCTRLEEIACTASASCRRDCRRLHETARDCSRLQEVVSAAGSHRGGHDAADRLRHLGRRHRRRRARGQHRPGGASRAPARATESSTLSSFLVDARRRCCRTLSSATSPSATCPTAGSRRCRSCCTTLWCSARLVDSTVNGPAVNSAAVNRCSAPSSTAL